ncbi:protein RALF-like 1 [Nymphaea colorata]|nr:protein RALF-like 1 [Nymphaea colorata]
MATLCSRFILMVVVALVVSSDAGLLSGEGGDQLGWLHGRRACESSIEECMGGEQIGMESEINRRILQAASQYIGYGALIKGSTPCSVSGASYYNCRPGAEANPYTRSCSVITRCARS